MKIFIACSKYFYDKVNEIKNKLEAQGHTITLPNSYEEPFKEEQTKKAGLGEHIKFKQKMMRLHEPKIKENDALFVLNLEKKGIPNYIGGATFMEIVKAWELNKKIFFYNPLPRCAFTDEIIAMQPIILNGNLRNIR